MTFTHFLRATAFLAVMCAGSAALAQDSVAAREAAADRYLRVVPIAGLLDDSFRELSKQVPPGQRADFLAKAKVAVRADALERMARESMVKTFTADELNALADFYGSRHGQSAVKKFGVYMAQVTPAIQAEVQRGLQEIAAQRKP